jgi:hypothetical protein
MIRGVTPTMCVQLSLTRLDAQNPGVCRLQRRQRRRRGRAHRTRDERLDPHAGRVRLLRRQRLLQRGGDLSAPVVGNQRHLLACLNREADLDSVLRTGKQIGRGRTECHPRLL